MIRNFCWTGYPDQEGALPLIPTVGEHGVTYTIYGREICPTTNRLHLQGYSELEQPCRFTTLKARYPTLHIESRKGTQQQAIDYCKKDGEVTETGAPKRQGKRKDLDDVVEAVNAGVPIDEIARAEPGTFIKYHKGIIAYKNTMLVDRTEPPTVEWRWGSTGTGKTRGAVDKHREAGFYIKDGTHWWDGYSGQQAIIIDDFDPKSWSFRDLLRLLDRYPFQGQTKGGYVRINSPFIYITCEHAPEHYWAGNDLAQVMRRITTVIHCE